MKTMNELKIEAAELRSRLRAGENVMTELNIVDAEIAHLRRIARHADISSTLGFHWQNGWYFQRQSDGSVRVLKFQLHDREPQEVFCIDANSWCSIVCSVSGDYGPGRLDQARAFHKALDGVAS